MEAQYNIAHQKHKETIPHPTLPATLICIITLPAEQTLPRLCEFYQNISDLCLDWCRGELIGHLAEKTHANDHTKEWLYRLNISALPTEHYITVTLTVTLSDRTERKGLARHSETHLWDSDGARMIRKHKKSKSGKHHGPNKDPKDQALKAEHDL